MSSNSREKIISIMQDTQISSMPSILTTATLTCKDPQARQQVISAFKNIIAYTAPHEPEVLQYVCALLESDATDTKIYMIEEYVFFILSV